MGMVKRRSRVAIEISYQHFRPNVGNGPQARHYSLRSQVLRHKSQALDFFPIRTKSRQPAEAAPMCLNNLAPEVGLEPTTLRLTAAPEAVQFDDN
jgi:hypothetical protein